MSMYSTTRFAFQDTPLSKWKAVVLAWECAAAACEEFRRDQLEPARVAFAVVRSQWPEESKLAEGSIAALRIAEARGELTPIEARFETLGQAVDVAVDELMTTPAPSVAAMAAKLAIIADEERRGTLAAAEIHRLLLADARRLSGEAG